MKRIRQTGPHTLIVEADSPEDLNKLLRAEQLKEKGYKVEKINCKMPRIVIYDIPTAIHKDDLVDEIYGRNEFLSDSFTKADFISKARPLFRWTKTKSKYSTHWVMEVAPEVRTIVKEHGNRMYMGWTANRVADYLDASRCYKCQLYGHVTKHCKSAKDTCGHCGRTGHLYKECVNKNNGSPVCTPCRKSGRDHNHSVKDRNCTARNIAIRDVIRRTTYVN